MDGPPPPTPARPPSSPPSQSSLIQPSTPPSPPDAASFSTENALAAVRRRRVVDPRDVPQARIFKKARMRTRNWSELRRRAQQQQANPPAPALDEPSNPQPDHVLADDPEQISAQPVASVPNPVLGPALGASPTSQALTVESITQTHLPRDHLLLLVPPTPDSASGHPSAP